MADTPMEQFYGQLQTLPRLISDLALSVAEAQRRMDQNYLNELTAFGKIVNDLLAHASPPNNQAAEFINIFKAIGPSRYQFTETSVEVRADLEMTSSTGTDLAAQVGIKTPVFAVTVNASYSKRSAYDYRASALIRTQLNAIPSNPDVIEKLLDRSAHYSAPLPNDDRFKQLIELLKRLPQVVGSPV